MGVGGCLVIKSTGTVCAQERTNSIFCCSLPRGTRTQKMSVEDKAKLKEQKIINEEYKLWKKNAPYLYDMLVTHSLSWPSLSVQFFPEATRNEASSTTTQRLLISTHTSQNEDEFIKILSATIPDTVFSDEESYDVRMDTEQQIRVKDDVNRTRMSHKMSNLIAARSDSEDVHVFDYTKHLSMETAFMPELVLKGHEKGGYGLSWNYNNKNVLATSGEDGLVCVFDIEKNTAERLTGHDGVVGDCCFSFFNENVLFSCGDDKNIIVWDTRTKKHEKIENAHTAEIYALNCSMLEDNVVCTGSKDTSVRVWDMRRTQKELFTLLSHKKEVLQVQFSPHFSNILASSGTDRRVCVWDLDRVGTLQTVEEKEDGPPELLFLHGGHTNTVCDFSFNSLEPWEIASVAEDNVIQIWQMSRVEKDKDVD